MSLTKSKYWAAFQNDTVDRAFSHCNPSSRAIRAFLPLENCEFDDLIPTPSTDSWAKRYSTVYRIRNVADIARAVELLEVAYQRI